jgi:hypothetical protein
MNHSSERQITTRSHNLDLKHTTTQPYKRYNLASNLLIVSPNAYSLLAFRLLTLSTSAFEGVLASTAGL